MSSIAGNTGTKEDLDRCLSSMAEAADNLLKLVNDIIDMTGFDTDRFDFVSHTFSFSKAVGSVIDNAARQALAKKQLFCSDIDSSIHDWIDSDERRLIQVLSNLLSNAVKFTPEGGRIEFSARLASSEPDNITIRFDIADNGIGMSPETLERLSEIFEQGDNNITREHSGMGLSLPLAKRIIDLMQGELKVESEQGKGSRFTCIVKFGIAHPVPELEAADAGDSQMLNLTGKRILIVDDVDINREIMRMMLEDTGAILEDAGTGDEAVKMFAQEQYDLILMDLHMPVMDGYTAAAAIRSSGYSRVPIIAVSAESSVELHAKCREAGITDYMAKPVEMDALFKMIAKHMPAQGNAD
jgi:CheY-like chemotaxis protein/anti-sigma regulatory factor (Ser/Thr protein kinase)